MVLHQVGKAAATRHAHLHLQIAACPESGQYMCQALKLLQLACACNKNNDTPNLHWTDAISQTRVPCQP